MNERILHYRVVRPLGAGGMGEVVLAEDEKLGRRVALKFLPRADSADPERRERLRREARALASLSHPGIAAVYALEEHGDRLFLAMEFVEGETLSDRLGRRPLPVAEVVERGRVLAEALAHAHARGVVHRDIKPSNILITHEGATKLADFGLAFQAGETRLTAEGSTAGTADHMSPEQTRGETVDRRSDLFSLGVVLYESLTGVRPFARPSLEATFHAIRADEPEPPTALRSGIPLELERIVMKLLRKDPGARYQTADDLAADLRVLSLEAGRGSAAGTRATSGATEPHLATASMPSAATTSSSATGASGTIPAPRRSRRLLLALPALLALAAIAYLLGGLRTPSGGEAVAAQRSIAVVSFQNVQDPADPRREAIMAASLLTVGLGQSQVIPVVGAQRVHDVIKQVGKSDQAVTGADALLVGRRAGATYVVTGYVFQTMPNVVLGAEVANVADGAVLTSRRVSVPGGEQAIFAAVDSLTIALRDDLARAGFGVRSTPVDVAGQTTRNPIAYRAYAHGLDLLHQGDAEGARPALLSAVAADSTFSQAWYHLAVATWWVADFPEAVREVETGLRLGARLSERDREALLALRCLVHKDWNQARERYERLTRRYPDDKEFWYGLGEALWHGGRDNEGARAAMLKALELDPQFGIAHVHAIDVDVAREDLEGALADIERMRRQAPGNTGLQGAEVVVYGMLGYPDSAIAHARRFMRISPRPWATRQLFILYAMTGQFDSARAVLPSIVRSAGPDAPLIPLLANAWLALAGGRLREAEAIAARGVSPDHDAKAGLFDAKAELLSMRASALLEMGRKEEAVRFALQGEKLPRRPDGSPALRYSEIVDLCARSGNLPEARRVLRRQDEFLERSPSFARQKDRDFSAGLITLAEGRAKEAVAMFRNSMPDDVVEIRDVERRWALARALLAAGDHDAAVVELEKVARRSPYAGDAIGAFHAMLLLAKEYEKQGRREEALAAYRRIAFQYRNADPGLYANEEAKAGIARLMRARARASAD